jgi:hypothetical protein
MANMGSNETTGQERPTMSSSKSAPAVPTQGRSQSRWKVHLVTFVVTVLVVWGVGTFAYIFFSPRFAYSRVESAVVSGNGSGFPAVPINTLYTQPTLASPTQANTLESTGNRDTLYTIGWLDLGQGPQVLHVPDMADRYYAVQFTDPWGTVFAYVGRRATGTQAGDYLITGPGWQGTVPKGVTQQIKSPNNTVLLIGRTLVESDGDLATAYGLARQIQVTSLSQWQPSH